MERVHVDLNGPPQTMLATLYAKALDADAPKSILRDEYAKAAVQHIDYDWAATTITKRRAPSVAVRSAHFDNWAREFLAAHPEATVLHVGCGLDARVFRLDPGPGVRWYDIDYPEVISLRERVYPARENCRTVAASVTDPQWLADLPADRPTLFLGEGLTMYLTKDAGLALLRRVVDRFPSGELQFDAFNTFGIRTQVINSVVRRSGSTLYWGSTGRPTSSTRCLARGWWPGNRCSTARRSHSYPRRAVDGPGDGAGAGAAEHGAVPPLRLLKTGMWAARMR